MGKAVGCVVRSSESHESQQGPAHAPGVSAQTVGAETTFNLVLEAHR
jgi:uncharacterized RmlC-like cupin family protein